MPRASCYESDAGDGRARSDHHARRGRGASRRGSRGAADRRGARDASARGVRARHRRRLARPRAPRSSTRPLPAGRSRSWRNFAARYVTEVCAQREAAIAAPTADGSSPIDRRRRTAVDGAANTATPSSSPRVGASSPPRSRTPPQRLTRSRPTCTTATPRGTRSGACTWPDLGGESRRRRRAVRVPRDLHDALRPAGGKAQHAPLGQGAARNTRAQGNNPRSPASAGFAPFHGSRLLGLLGEPVRRAAAECAWLAALVESGELFHPLRWSIAEARALLDDVPRVEAAGVIVRVPSAWRGGVGRRRPASQRDGRREESGGCRRRSAARLRGRRDARRRAPDARRDRGAARGGRRLGARARALGRDRSQPPRRDAESDSATPSARRKTA